MKHIVCGWVLAMIVSVTGALPGSAADEVPETAVDGRAAAQAGMAAQEQLDTPTEAPAEAIAGASIVAETPKELADQMPPAPLQPWRVTGHAVGDSASHVLDVAASPVYRVCAPAWWWMERGVYRKQSDTIRVSMPEPVAEPPVVPAPTPEIEAAPGATP